MNYEKKKHLKIVLKETYLLKTFTKLTKYRISLEIYLVYWKQFKINEYQLKITENRGKLIGKICLNPTETFRI